VRCPSVFAALAVALVTAGCPRKVPPPQWSELHRERAVGVRRIAVVGGRYAPAVTGCMLGATKAMIEAFHLQRRYQVRSYRDVLVALKSADVEAVPAAPTIEPGLAARLADRLAVDAVVVLSMTACGAQTGDRVTVGLFATPDGTRLGGYETDRAGLQGTGAYYQASSLESIARETVEAFERTMAAP